MHRVRQLQRVYQLCPLRPLQGRWHLRRMFEPDGQHTHARAEARRRRVRYERLAKLRAERDAQDKQNSNEPSQASPSAADPQPAPSAEPAANDGRVMAYFAPNNAARCAEVIVSSVAAAKTSVKVQAYRLTSKPIGKALLEAHRRGLAVTVVLDGRSSRRSTATPRSSITSACGR